MKVYRALKRVEDWFSRALDNVYFLALLGVLMIMYMLRIFIYIWGVWHPYGS